MADRVDQGGSAVDDGAGARADAEGREGGDAADEADLLGEPRPAPIESQRGPGDPELQRVSFTNRRSWAEQAFTDAGLNPDEATLLPAKEQFAILQTLVEKRFGIKADKTAKLQTRFAVDQMLDLYRNLQLMAHIMGVPTNALGLGNKLNLVFRKDIQYLGAYYPVAAKVEGLEFPAGTIALPKRSNSFAHEWMHALDHYLTSLLGPTDFILFSQQVKNRGIDDMPPGSVKEAFVRVMDTLFFDQASLAARILALEMQLEKPNISKTAKEKAEAQLATLRAGNARTKTVERSDFDKKSSAFQPGNEDYWGNPQEMLARAFEAYTAFKVEAAGGSTEAIAKGDLAYLSEADRRLAMVYPKGEERLRIFAAFDSLFAKMAEEQLIANGVAAANPSNIAKYDPRQWDKMPAKPPEYAGVAGAVRETIDDLKAEVERMRRMAERPDNPKTIGQRVEDAAPRFFFYTQQGAFRALERRYPKSRTLRAMSNLFTTAPGQDRLVKRTFEEAVEQTYKGRVNQFSNIVTNFKLNKLSADGLRELRDLLISAAEPRGHSLAPAAAALRRFLDTEWYRNQQAGLDIGYTRNGYLPRMIDMANVMADQSGFVRQAAKVYEIIFDSEIGADAEAVVDKDARAFLRLAKQYGINIKPALKILRRLRNEQNKEGGPDDAKIDQITADLTDEIAGMFDKVRSEYGLRRAGQWHTRLMTASVQDFDTMSPDSTYTKSRALPPEADKIMEEFYINDPLEAIQHYLFASARRVEFTQRFGKNGEKINAMMEQLTAEGVTPEDQAFLGDIITSLTGRRQAGLPIAVSGFANYVHAIGTMSLLPRAVLSSIVEPTVAAIRSGNLADSFRPFFNLVKMVVGTADARDWAEIARVIGAVSSGAADTLVANRFGGAFGNTIKSDFLLSRFFQRTMLTGLTNAQRTAVLPLAHAFLTNTAARIKQNGPDSQNVALLKELGIDDVLDFSDWILQSEKVPNVDELFDSNGIATPNGDRWMTAVNRYIDQVIQNPKGYDRPLAANSPAGRLAYGILSFSMSFYNNVWKRSATLVKETYQRKGATGAAGMIGLQLIPGVIALGVMQGILSTIREAIFNPERWEEWEREGTLQQNLLFLGATRSYPTGLLDPLVQAFTGLKYQRDISNVVIGAVPSFFLQGVQAIAGLAINNSENTNNAEYKAAQAAYQLVVTPLIVGGLSMAPGGRLIDPLYGLAMMQLTSPGVRDAAANAVVGEKDSRRKARERQERQEQRDAGRDGGRGESRREGSRN